MARSKADKVMERKERALHAKQDMIERMREQQEKRDREAAELEKWREEDKAIRLAASQRWEKKMQEQAKADAEERAKCKVIAVDEYEDIETSISRAALEEVMSHTRKVTVSSAGDPGVWATGILGGGSITGTSIISSPVAPSHIECGGVKYYPQKPSLPQDTRTVVYVPPCRSAPMGFHEAYTTTAVYRSDDDGMTWKLTNGHK